ncbi:hypothetical protein [Desulfoplanes sp.]
MTTIPLGSPLHISVPRLQGCWLQTDGHGLNLNLNFPDTTDQEMAAFSQGIRTIGMFAADTIPPVPFLLLGFKNRAFGPVEGTFDARSQHREYLDHFMDLPLPVRMGIFLSDMGRIRGIAHVVLPHRVTLALKETVQCQLSTPYTAEAFASNKLNIQTAYSTQQLLDMAYYVDE